MFPAGQDMCVVPGSLLVSLREAKCSSRWAVVESVSV